MLMLVLLMLTMLVLLMLVLRRTQKRCQGWSCLFPNEFLIMLVQLMLVLRAHAETLEGLDGTLHCDEATQDIDREAHADLVASVGILLDVDLHDSAELLRRFDALLAVLDRLRGVSVQPRLRVAFNKLQFSVWQSGVTACLSAHRQGEALDGDAVLDGSTRGGDLAMRSGGLLDLTVRNAALPLLQSRRGATVSQMHCESNGTARI